MKFKQIAVSATLTVSVACANAGGNPEFVKFPEGYADSYTNYVTMNRAGKELVAKMYANDVAVSSYKEGRQAAEGAVVIMEVYKPKKGPDGKVVIGKDGIYETDKLAAVAVMERNGSWDAAYPEDDRVGGWGFAIYNPDGTPKKNELNCPVCHTPFKEQDYLYTQLPLLEYARR
jgi:hypothetical protein